jgi:uncharacterized delta-60 repeat protein
MARKLMFWQSRRQNSSKGRHRVPLRDTILGLEQLEGRRLLSAGNLDPTFNPSGTPQGVLVADFGFVETGQSVSVQADGKVLIAGTIDSFTSQDFGVARFLANGQLDTTFGTGDSDGVDGLATADFFGGQDIAYDMITDSLGRILVVGQGRSSTGSSGVAVARFDTNGNLDSSFGTGGKFLQSISGFVVEPRGVALQNDGKLVVTGNMRTGSSSTFNFLTARINPNGGMDTSFGGLGYVMTDFNSNLDQAYDVAVQSDGKIVVGGTVTTAGLRQFGLARYNVNGTLDTAADGIDTQEFGVGGRVRTNVIGLEGPFPTSDTIWAMAVQGDGKIVVAGNTSNGDISDAIVARYNVDGSLDTSFNAAGSQAGVLTVNVSTRDFAEGLTIQPDGDYVVVGSSTTVTGVFPNPVTSDDGLMVIRVLESTGELDTSFGTGGVSVTNLVGGNTNEVLRDVAIQPDGKIVTGGVYGTDFVMARYESGLAQAPSIGGDADVDEGAAYTLSLLSSDPTTSQWTINWGDSVQIVSGNPGTVTHTFADGNANYTISATATTDTGTFAAGNTVDVSVLNVAPTLALSGAATVDEGSPYTLDLSSFDPGDDTITSWTIHWGDGSQTVAGNPTSVAHTYADGDADYLITATATDEDGTFAAGNSLAVSVLNVAPTLALSGAATVDEGSPYTLDLSSFDPGDDTIASWTIHWGDGSQTVAGNPASVAHTYADGDADYLITATATDEDGTFAAGNSLAVSVLNVAPTADAGGPYTTFDDIAISLNGSGFDVPADQPDLIFEWDFDGNLSTIEAVGQTPTFDPVALGISGMQTVAVTLRVSDGDGGTALDTAQVTVLGVGASLIDGTLHVIGTEQKDVVVINKAASKLQVISSFTPGPPLRFDLSSVTDIHVRVRGGNDVVVVAGNVTLPAIIDGGSGEDVLTGGNGPSVILGGPGDDVLVGGNSNNILVGGDGSDVITSGSGRDLLIGGDDSDVLSGGAGEDILIGGWTVHDNDTDALRAVMDIWESSASFDSRVATLTEVDGLLEPNVAVFNDDDGDILVGGAARDLIFGDTNPWDGAMDLIALQPFLDELIAVT